MANIWQLQKAKNKFSELVEKARHEGPQFVTKHGKESVVVLSVEDYHQIVQPQSNLYDFIQNSPLHGIDLGIERDKSAAREVDL